MTREETIINLENLIALFHTASEQSKMVDYSKIIETLEFSAAALRPISRERVERMSGEWVHEPNKRFSLFYCSSCGETFEIHSYEVKKYGFCPYCGIPMTDKAVDMVMERINKMEGMENESC